MSIDASEYSQRIRALAFDEASWTPRAIEDMRDFLSPWNHNIRLAEGIYTAYCEDWYPAHQAIMNVIDSHLSGSYRGKRVLDLGCLEGYFSLECALHGSNVVGIDAKEINVKKCQFVKSVLGARNLSFLLDDAMNVTREHYGSFDVVLALGLLYHLDDPFTFLAQISELCEGFLVLDTLVAAEEEKQMVGEWMPELLPPQDFSFSGKSYPGRLYREYQEGADDVERAFSVTASHTNNMSLWLTEEALVNLLCDVGFKRVEKMNFPQERDVWWSNPRNARVLYTAHRTRPFSSRIFVPD